MGINRLDFFKKRDELFEDCDLQFNPRQGSKIDKKIEIILKILKITDVPVVNLKDELYLIGLYKFNLELKGDFVSL